MHYVLNKYDVMLVIGPGLLNIIGSWPMFYLYQFLISKFWIHCCYCLIWEDTSFGLGLDYKTDYDSNLTMTTLFFWKYLCHVAFLVSSILRQILLVWKLVIRIYVIFCRLAIYYLSRLRISFPINRLIDISTHRISWLKL